MTMVSVIMAVYNGERFIEEAIDSVLIQTHRDFEFVIVDDGSTDRTGSILASYSQQDQRVKVYHQMNQGPAAARNKAILIACNELVAVMDADDRMLPDRLKRQLSFYAENPDATVICSYSYLINGKGRRIGMSRNEIDVAAGIEEMQPAKFLEIVNPSVMMKKNDILALGGYDGQFAPVEDRDLWGRIVTHGKLIKCQPECLMEYRLHGGSLSMINFLKPSFKSKTIDLNVIRRLKGEPELSIREVEAMLDSRPMFQRWNEQRKHVAMKFYKNSTRMYAEENLPKFALFFGMSLLLRPVVSMRRALSKRSHH